MKSDHFLKAEQEARQACAGLGWNEAQIQSFVDMHIEGEARRALERELELQSAKRNKALTDAIIHAAVDPWRERYAHKDFHEDTTLACSTGHDAEDKRDADTHQRQRNRGKT